MLMTSLLGPDAELRWANWLKLLQIPQSLILYRSPKIVTKFTRDHFLGPFDIDYKNEKPRNAYLCRGWAMLEDMQVTRYSDDVIHALRIHDGVVHRSIMILI